MRSTNAIILFAMGIMAGIVLPYFFQDTFSGAGFSYRGSEYEISTTAILWFLRILGACFGVWAVILLILAKHSEEP